MTAWPSDSAIRKACLTAIEQAKASERHQERESGATARHPLVGAAAISANGQPLEAAGRDGRRNRHAEVNLLDQLSRADETEQVHTVVTTLEPCCYRGQLETLSCAKRIARLGPQQVVIGTLDPAPGVRGRGLQVLGLAGVYLAMFPRTLQEDLHDINARYWERNARLYRSSDRMHPSSGIVSDDREFDLLLAPKPIREAVKSHDFSEWMFLLLRGWLRRGFRQAPPRLYRYNEYVAIIEANLSYRRRSRSGLGRFFRGSSYETLATYLAINSRTRTRFDVYGEVARWWYSRCGFRHVHDALSPASPSTLRFDIG